MSQQKHLKLTLFLAFTLGATCFMPQVTQATDVAGAKARNRIYQQLTRVQRTLNRLNKISLENGSALKASLSGIQSSVDSLSQTVRSQGAPEPVTRQAVIGTNSPSVGYVGIAFPAGVRAQSLIQHKGTGIQVTFRTYDGAKLLDEYSLSFSFEGRSSDQKTADAFMLNSCVNQFHRAADAANGGIFYVYASGDDTVGLVCSSDLS